MDWQDKIPLYINGTLSAKERQEMESLLKESPPLQAAFNEWLAISQAVHAETKARLASPPPFSELWASNVTPRMSRLKKFGLTLAAALVLIVAGLLIRHEGKTPVQTTIIQPEHLQLIERQRLGRGHLADIIWSPDGKTIAAPGVLGTWLYSAEDLSREPRLLHGQAVSVIFSLDSALIATSEPDGMVNIWNLATGDLVTRLETQARYPVYQLAFSPDNARLATFLRDQAIVLWDINTGERLHELPDTDVGGLMCLAFDHAQPYFYTLHASAFGATPMSTTPAQLFIWDLQGNRVNQVELRDSDMLTCSFSGNGTRLALLSLSIGISVFDMATQSYLSFSRDSTASGRQVKLSQTGDIMVSYLEDLLAVWDLTTGNLPGVVPVYPDEVDRTGHYRWLPDSTLSTNGSPVAAQMLGSIDRLTLSPDGSQVAILYKNGVVAMLPLGGSGQAQVLLAHRNLGRNPRYLTDTIPLMFSTDSHQLFVGVEGVGVQAWNVETGEAGEVIMQLEASTLRGMSYNSNEHRLVVASEVAPGNFVLVRRKVDADSLSGNGSYIPPVGSFVFVVDDDGSHNQLSLWPQQTSAFALHPNGQQFAASPIVDDATISLIDIETQAREELSAQPASVLAYSPDGTLLAAAFERRVQLWNTVERTDLFTFSRHEADVTDMAFSPDSQILAMVNRARMLRLLEATTFTEVASFQAPGPIQAVAFSPDGNLIALGINNGGLILVDVDENISVVSTDDGGIAGVAFSPDGQLIATAGFDGTVRIWSIANGVSTGSESATHS